MEWFVSDGPDACEVPDALEFIDGVDDVGFPYGRDAICLNINRGTWSFADVRGSAASAIRV